MSLQKIQSELKAPKNQYNSFGKYNYRSAEDIVEAVKPILAKYEYSLITPQVVMEVGGRIYIQTDARLLDKDGNVVGSATAQAREEDKKKGMDASQLSGATGSYSKKYALNNLFAIDDTRDADATNDHGEAQQKAARSKPKTDMYQTFIERVDSFKTLDELEEWAAKSWGAVKKSLTDDEFKKAQGYLEQIKKVLAESRRE